METISSDGWEDKFADGVGPVCPVFLKRLETSFKLLDVGVMERVNSVDLWAIVRGTVRAYVPRIDDEPQNKIPLKLYYQGIPITEEKEKCVKAIYDFQNWLRRHISLEDEKILRRRFSASAGKIDVILQNSFKNNVPEDVKNAVNIWCKILELGDENYA